MSFIDKLLQIINPKSKSDIHSVDSDDSKEHFKQDLEEFDKAIKSEPNSYSERSAEYFTKSKTPKEEEPDIIEQTLETFNSVTNNIGGCLTDITNDVTTKYEELGDKLCGTTKHSENTKKIISPEQFLKGEKKFTDLHNSLAPSNSEKYSMQKDDGKTNQR